MQINHNLFKVFLFLLFVCTVSCRKDFLNRKPKSDIVIPSAISDMMQLLEYYNFSPSLGILSADEYYCPDMVTFNSLYTGIEKNCYTWNTDIYGGATGIESWNDPWQTVVRANTVLDQWTKLSAPDQAGSPGKYVRGWALYSRSYAFFNLAQIFSPVYNQASAGTDLGIPLKLSPDINDIQPRASVQRTYDQIISDLETAIPLHTDVFPFKDRKRSSKASIYALLGRIYLYMGDYGKALNAADSSLFFYDQLIDYNQIDTTARYPFDRFNKELLLYDVVENTLSVPAMGSYAMLPADTNLVALLEPGDLRRSVRFYNNNGVLFNSGSYNGSPWPFTGVAVDEVYLIRAECLARTGNLADACTTLNQLLQNRYTPATFTPFSSGDHDIVLRKVLTERRKELAWRGTRWNDLKRLNRDGANITLTRNLDGKIYTLPPNDPRYVLPIPDDEIALSHIQQNKR